MASSSLCSAGRLASRLSSTPHHLQQSMTLAFLENQLASALALQSSQEYRYWLLIYARFLVIEGKPLVETQGRLDKQIGHAHRLQPTSDGTNLWITPQNNNPKL